MSKYHSYDLDVTIISAKHLKNVNWRNGDLKPYAIVYLDPDRRQATRPDDSGSTRPVWNERFVLPLTLTPEESTLTIELFHSKPSDTPKPLIGTVRFEIRNLLVVDADVSRIRTMELRRPSGRPQGKIRIKLGLIDRYAIGGDNLNHQTHQNVPGYNSYYYNSSTAPYLAYSTPPTPTPPLPPPVVPPQQPYYSYPSDAYSYSSYSVPRSPSPVYTPYIGAQVGPSAPVDYTNYSSYHHYPRAIERPSAPVAVDYARYEKYPDDNSNYNCIEMRRAMGGLTLEEGRKSRDGRVDFSGRG